MVSAIKNQDYELAISVVLGLVNIVGPSDEELIERFRQLMSFENYLKLLVQKDIVKKIPRGIVFNSMFYQRELRTDSRREDVLTALIDSSVNIVLRDMLSLNDTRCDKWTAGLEGIIDWKAHKDDFLSSTTSLLATVPVLVMKPKDLTEAAKRLVCTPSKFPEYRKITYGNACAPVVEGEYIRVPPCDECVGIPPCFLVGCATCGGKAELECGGCKRIKYCDRDCQKWDWPRHKLDCKNKA